MIPAPFQYVRAGNLDHALELLEEPDAKALAGGQSLLPVLKLRVASAALVVDVSRLPLRGVDIREEHVHVGPLTTWAELDTAPELRKPGLEAVAECAAGIGDLQVRNRGTIGGSLAHADPASDMAAVLMVLGARLRLRSQGGERTVPAAEFLLGPFLTALEPEELVVDVSVPVPARGSGSAYVSVEHPASGFALAGAAARVDSRDAVSVAVTGVAGRPFLLPAGVAVEDALADAEVYGDRFAPADYRRALASVVVGRALAKARARAHEAHS